MGKIERIAYGKQHVRQCIIQIKSRQKETASNDKIATIF